MPFMSRIRPRFDAALPAARSAKRIGDALTAFAHLERAHVLVQSSTWRHVRMHWLMLLWGLRERRAGEVAGQLLRVVGAATKTPLGMVPTGNTGSANVSPFRRTAIAPELQRLMDSARTWPEVLPFLPMFANTKEARMLRFVALSLFAFAAAGYAAPPAELNLSIRRPTDRSLRLQAATAGDRAGHQSDPLLDHQRRHAER